MQNKKVYGSMVFLLTLFMFPRTVQAAESGLVQQENGQWFFMREGLHDTSVNGLFSYDGAWFFLRDGVVDTSLRGIVDYDGSKF